MNVITKLLNGVKISSDLVQMGDEHTKTLTDTRPIILSNSSTTIDGTSWHYFEIPNLSDYYRLDLMLGASQNECGATSIFPKRANGNNQIYKYTSTSDDGYSIVFNLMFDISNNRIGVAAIQRRGWSSSIGDVSYILGWR